MYIDDVLRAGWLISAVANHAPDVTLHPAIRAHLWALSLHAQDVELRRHAIAALAKHKHPRLSVYAEEYERLTDIAGHASCEAVRESALAALAAWR